MSIEINNDLFHDPLALILYRVTREEGHLHTRLVCRTWRRVFDTKVLAIFFAKLQQEREKIPEGLRRFVPDRTSSIHFEIFQEFHKQLERTISPRGINLLVVPEEIDLFNKTDTNLHLLWDVIKTQMIVFDPDLQSNPLQTADQINAWMEAHPEALSSLTCLSLNQGWNSNAQRRCTALPTQIRFFTHLKEFHCFFQRMPSLPKEFETLTEIETLRIINNKELKRLPSLAHLTQLEIFELTDNDELTSLPPGFENLITLQELSIANNQKLTTLPSFRNLTALQRLSIIGKEALTHALIDSPCGVENLTMLYELNLADNNLDKLPSWVPRLTQLKILWLSYNKLQALPSEIGDLVELKALNLISNEITILPSTIGNLSNLRTLYLSKNQLTYLSHEIGKLQNLEVLHLSNNHLQELPSQIGNLIKLRSLYLNFNQLKQLPLEMDNLTQLQDLYITGNAIENENIPPELKNRAEQNLLYLVN